MAWPFIEGYSICSRGPVAVNRLQWLATPGNRLINDLMPKPFSTGAPFYETRSTIILVWISNHVHVEVWDEITDPFSNLTGIAAS